MIERKEFIVSLTVVLAMLIGCERSASTVTTDNTATKDDLTVVLSINRAVDGHPSLSSPTPIVWLDQRSETTLWELDRPLKICEGNAVSGWISDKMFTAYGVPEGKAAVLEHRSDGSVWLVGYQEAPW